MPGDALDVFISYSQEDQTLRQELEEQLVDLRREGLIGTWQERRLAAGEEDWRGWVDGDLRSADLVLLIVSTPFLESDYCRDAEVKCALERHASGFAKVIPIIARPCDWRSAPFANLDNLPQGVGPVTEWHHREDAWEDVAEGIREVANRLIEARLESTAAYRIVVRGPIRQPERPAEPPSEEVPDAGTPRSAVVIGLAAVLAALAAVLYFAWWRPQQLEDDSAVIRAGVKPPGAEAGQPSPAAPPPGAAAESERPPATTSTAAPETEPDPAATPAAADLRPEDFPPPETIPEDPVPADEATDAGDAGDAGDAALTPPAPVVEARPQDFERALGILAEPGAESESECLAALIADEYALTSRACAQASAVIVMGGNALTATRDEIFDLDPREAAQTTEVNLVKLYQGLGGSYGFAATEIGNRIDPQRLTAHFVAAAAVRKAECVAAEHLAATDLSGAAYVGNAAFDRYVHFVEAAADEVISFAGAEWAELLPEVLESTDENIAGFVCALPRTDAGTVYRPAGSLVLSDAGRVVGIGYPCEPFDRMEPEILDSLPEEIRQLNLDCIAPLGGIRARLRAVLGETAGQ